MKNWFVIRFPKLRVEFFKPTATQQICYSDAETFDALHFGLSEWYKCDQSWIFSSGSPARSKVCFKGIKDVFVLIEKVEAMMLWVMFWKAYGFKVELMRDLNLNMFGKCKHAQCQTTISNQRLGLLSRFNIENFEFLKFNRTQRKFEQWCQANAEEIICGMTYSSKNYMPALM